MYLLIQSVIDDEIATKEIVVKNGETWLETGRLKLVYHEHVEFVDVPINSSSRLKANDILGRYLRLAIFKCCSSHLLQILVL